MSRAVDIIVIVAVMCSMYGIGMLHQKYKGRFVIVNESELVELHDGNCIDCGCPVNNAQGELCPKCEREALELQSELIYER